MGFPLFSEPEWHQRGVPPEVSWHLYVERCRGILHELRQELGLSGGQLAFAAADAFLEHLFGDGWFDANLPEAELLRKSTDDPSIKRRYLLEVTQLGRYLFDLQDFDFFPDLVLNLKQRPNELRAMMFEAEVVWLIKFLPFRSGLRIPTGTKGDDFDIAVVLGERELAVEVKAKDDGPFTENALRKTLDKARAQLPPRGLGVVFVRVPDDWLADPAYQDVSDRIVEDRLRSSGRLHAVVLVADGWLTEADVRFQKPVLSARVFLAEDADPSVAFLLAQYERLWEQPPGFAHPIWSGVI